MAAGAPTWSGSRPSTSSRTEPASQSPGSAFPELALVGLAEFLGEDLHEGLVGFLLHGDELAFVIAPQCGIAGAREDAGEHAHIFGAAADRARGEAVERGANRTGDRLECRHLGGLQVQ